MNRYKFKAPHIHTLDGKPLIGITTALSVIAKPALIQWAANMAIDYVEKEVKEIVTFKDVFALGDEWSRVLKEAKTAHRRKKEEAGEKGTDVHAVVEEIVKNAIEFHGGRVRTGKNPTKQIQLFIDWAIDNKVKFLESEKHLYSEKYWIGGICDMVFEIEGRKYVGDVKTSKAIYPENFLQMAGYRLMLEDMGEKDFHGSMVVRLGKDGSFETEERYDYQTDLETFLACLTLYKNLKQYK